MWPVKVEKKTPMHSDLNIDSKQSAFSFRFYGIFPSKIIFHHRTSRASGTPRRIRVSEQTNKQTMNLLHKTRIK